MASLTPSAPRRPACRHRLARRLGLLARLGGLLLGRLGLLLKLLHLLLQLPEQLLLLLELLLLLLDDALQLGGGGRRGGRAESSEQGRDRASSEQRKATLACHHDVPSAFQSSTRSYPRPESGVAPSIYVSGEQRAVTAGPHREDAASPNRVDDDGKSGLQVAVEQAQQDLRSARYVGIERGAGAGGVPTRERIEHRPVLEVGAAPVVRGAQQIKIGADLQPQRSRWRPAGPASRRPRRP